MKALTIIKKKKWLWVLLSMVVLLIPTVVLANALSPANNWVGMSGVSHSNLYVGMIQGTIHGQWWVGFNVSATYINPNTAVGGFINLYPLIFVGLGIVVAIWYIKEEGINIYSIMMLAIIFYILIALLIGIHDNNVKILGG